MDRQIYEIAKRVYLEKGSATEDVIDLFLREINQNETYVRELLELGAKDVFHSVQNHLRAAIAMDPGKKGPPPKVFSAEQQKTVQSRCGRWYDWPMMDGTRLGEATKEQVLADRDRYRANEIGNGKNRLFLEWVAGRMKDGQRVKQAFKSQDELGKLMERARKEFETS